MQVLDVVSQVASPQILLLASTNQVSSITGFFLILDPLLVLLLVFGSKNIYDLLKYLFYF